MYTVLKPVPAPTLPLDSYYTTFQVKERGWNPTMIQELMPRPDAAREAWGNVGMAGATVKLYLKVRVEELETTEDYLIVEERTRKKKEKRQQKEAGVIAAYVAQFKPRFRFTGGQGRMPKLFCCEVAVMDWQRTHKAAAAGFSHRRLLLATKALLEKSLELFAQRYPKWVEPTAEEVKAHWLSRNVKPAA